MVAIFAFLIPIGETAPGTPKFFSSGKLLMLRNDKTGRAFEMQPGEITRPAADERLRKSEKHHQQPRVNGIEARFDSSPYHIRKSDAKSAAEHQIRDDSQWGNEYADAKQKNRQREPFDAAEIRGHIGLRARVDRLEKSVCENSVINYRAIDEPAEAWRAVNLSSPLRCSGWSEKNEMFKAQERFGFAVTLLLFAERTQGETAMVPDDGRGTKRDDAAALLQTPAEINVIASGVIFRIKAAEIFKSPAPKCHVTARDVFGDRVG